MFLAPPSYEEVCAIRPSQPSLDYEEDTTRRRNINVLGERVNNINNDTHQDRVPTLGVETNNGHSNNGDYSINDTENHGSNVVMIKRLSEMRVPM